MLSYSYIALNKKGTKQSGTINAIDELSAANQIEKLGLIPISITDQSKNHSSKKIKKKINFELGFKTKPKMKLSDLLLFSRELSDLVASGMTIGKALHTLSNRKEKNHIQSIVIKLRDEIVQGSSLSNALELFPDTFSTLYRNLVKAGEESGNLSLALENICIHYERVYEAKGKVISALVYPSIVLIVGGIAVIGLMIFIVPKFAGTFEEMGATLPKPTLALMNFSTFIVNQGLLLIVILISIFFFIKRWIKTTSGKKLWHEMQLKIPIAGSIIKTNAFSHFSRTLGTLLENGVSILQALKIVQKTINNVVISSEIELARVKVKDGTSISRPLSKSKIFPSLLIDMIAVGEETGDMPAALKHITRRYDNELDRLVKTCTTILEPLLIVIVALIVGSIAVCLLLPVLTLTDSLSM
ncbi:MAG: type II secretion system F family protein [Verrucomicrobiota bacterium]|nr:type II secretion system F family protein [Verrucomicrobiota bacterium]